MSNQHVVYIACDKCLESHYEGSVDVKARTVRAEAKKEGWKLGKKRDLCPSCAAELDKAVKTLLAG